MHDPDAFWDNVHPRPALAAELAGLLADGLARAGVLPDAPGAPAAAPPTTAEPALNTARYWLRWAAIRHHDPALRLAQARRNAHDALALAPDDALARATLDLAEALERGRSVAVDDPTARERLVMLHPRIAALVEDPR